MPSRTRRVLPLFFPHIAVSFTLYGFLAFFCREKVKVLNRLILEHWQIKVLPALNRPGLPSVGGLIGRGFCQAQNYRLEKSFQKSVELFC